MNTTNYKTFLQVEIKQSFLHSQKIGCSVYFIFWLIKLLFLKVMLQLVMLTVNKKRTTPPPKMSNYSFKSKFLKLLQLYSPNSTLVFSVVVTVCVLSIFIHKIFSQFSDIETSVRSFQDEIFCLWTKKSVGALEPVLK